jgi:hypothetical protein
LRAKPTGWPDYVRAILLEAKKKRVTACGGISLVSFELGLDFNRPKTRRLVRPALNWRRRPLVAISQRGSDKRACLWTVEVARERRNSFHIPPPSGGHFVFRRPRDGAFERNQASQGVSGAKGIPLFESAGAFGAKTVTDKNLGNNILDNAMPRRVKYGAWIETHSDSLQRTNLIAHFI